jgi:hypothetical protein
VLGGGMSPTPPHTPKCGLLHGKYRRAVMKKCRKMLYSGSTIRGFVLSHDPRRWYHPGYAFAARQTKTF